MARFWGAALDYKVTAEENKAIETPSDAHSSRLMFLKVPEDKTVKNRVHLDLRPSDTSRYAEVDSLIGLGAQKVADFNEHSWTWTVLSDPEGNEFCVEQPIDPLMA
ncbi:MAG: VOC family protein [Dehalococcoidia bacterium]|nr:VOC family protein [Dehalococcoidia bacterium]